MVINTSLPAGGNNLRHGGDLTVAIQQFGGQPNDWLDLSTGISPWAYPELEVDQSVWRKLPDDSLSLRTSAAAYYGCQANELSLTPGSQLAIRLLPSLLKSKHRCAIPSIGYKEHEFAWGAAGHKLVSYASFSELQTLVKQGLIDSAVVINPNNPTGESVRAAQLLNLAKGLNGVLLVDEAFADFDSSDSVSSANNLSNVIVLRSIGKFFGLAGARVGFTITQHALGRELAALFSPWSVNSAAQIIAERALTNHTWQAAQRRKIHKQSQELNSIIKDYIHRSALTLQQTNQQLFTTLFGDDTVIKKLHYALAHQQIWTRIGDPFSCPSSTPQNWLRVSLPGANLAQLTRALSRLSIN